MRIPPLGIWDGRRWYVYRYICVRILRLVYFNSIGHLIGHIDYENTPPRYLRWEEVIRIDTYIGTYVFVYYDSYISIQLVIQLVAWILRIPPLGIWDGRRWYVLIRISVHMCSYITTRIFQFNWSFNWSHRFWEYPP
jgi:hypothetical protein